MNIRQMEYIVAIAEEKSLARAAEKIYISQAALSQSLTKLEQELGARIFNRQKNNYELTPAGKIYLETAREIIGLNRLCLERIEAISHPESGAITLGISSERSSALLPMVYPEFHRMFPDIPIHIREGHASHLTAMAADGEVDLTFAVLPAYPFLNQERNLISMVPIISEELSLITPRDHPLAVWSRNNPGSPVSLKRLSGASLISHAKAKTLRRILDDAFDRWDVRPREIFEISSTCTIIEFVEQGLGAAMVPSMFVRDSEKIQVLPTSPQLSWPLGFIYAKDKYLTQAEQGLIELIRQTLLREFPQWRAPSLSPSPQNSSQPG